LHKVDYYSSAIHRFGCFPQKLVQVRLLEQPVTVSRIAMHRDVTTSSPFADRIVVNAEVLGRLGRMHVFGQFGHGFGLNALAAKFAIRKA
jgi:hypothetical protein